MAIAMKVFKDASGIDLQYSGIDIMPDSIKFLGRKFSEDPKFKFYLNKVDSSVSYVSAEIKKSKTTAESNGVEGIFDNFLSDKINLQWSNSVFTHLTTAAARNSLLSIARISDPCCVHINTWLIIDELSRFSLKTKQADRSLPYDMGEYFTFSKENPLLCTAFKLEHIMKFYDDAGLEIVSIDRGSWRGNGFKNDANSYQDVIVSKPK